MTGKFRWRGWLEGPGWNVHICYWVLYGSVVFGLWFLKYLWVLKTQYNVFITHGPSVLSWLSFHRERVVVHLQWIRCLFSQLSHFVIVMQFIHLMLNIFVPPIPDRLLAHTSGVLFPEWWCVAVKLYSRCIDEDSVPGICKRLSCVAVSVGSASLFLGLNV